MQAEDVRLNMAAIEAIDALRPDEGVAGDRTLTVGGRALELHGSQPERVAACAADYIERTIRTPEHRVRFCPAA